MNTIIVFLFGLLGGCCRFLIGDNLPNQNGFPIATFLVNIMGCFLLAFLVKNYLVQKNASKKLILGAGTGFCGSFTTFSSLLLDAYKLLQHQQYITCIAYLFLSIVIGYLVVVLGYHLGRRVAR